MPSRYSSSSRRSNYSSVKSDPVGQRAAVRAKTEMKQRMRDNRKEAELKGRALMVAFKKAQPKNADSLQDTGTLIRPLTRDIADRSEGLGKWIEGQMISKIASAPKEVKKFQKKHDATRKKSEGRIDLSKHVLDYDVISLVQYVPDPLHRASVLEKALAIATENDNAKLLRRVIAAGIDYKINAPLDALIDHLNPTEHLNLLKNKIRVPEPLNDTSLLGQFKSLKEKVVALKPVAQKKMLHEMAKIHPDKKQADKLIAEKAAIKTSRTKSVAKTAPGTIEAEQKIIELDQLLKDTVPGMEDANDIALRFEMLDSEYIPDVKQPLMRSKFYQQLGELYPVNEEKGFYYRQSIRAAAEMKNGPAQAKRLKHLRDNDPFIFADQKIRLEAHKAFTQNATLVDLMTDGTEQKAKAQQVSEANGDKGFSARMDDPHMMAYNKYADLVPITINEVTRRKKTMTITQKRVFEKHKASLGLL